MPPPGEAARLLSKRLLLKLRLPLSEFREMPPPTEFEVLLTKGLFVRVKALALLR